MTERRMCEYITRNGKGCSQPVAQRYYQFGIRHCTSKHLDTSDITILRANGVEIGGKVSPIIVKRLLSETKRKQIPSHKIMSVNYPSDTKIPSPPLSSSSSSSPFMASNSTPSPRFEIRNIMQGLAIAILDNKNNIKELLFKASLDIANIIKGDDVDINELSTSNLPILLVYRLLGMIEIHQMQQSLPTTSNSTVSVGLAERKSD